MKNSLKQLSDEKKLFIMHGIGFVLMCLYGAKVHDLARAFPNFVGRLLFPSNLCLWEQGKILLTGMSVWFLIEYIFVGRKLKGFVFIHTIIASALPILMLAIYLTHTKLFGDFSLDGAHIALSILLIMSAFLVSVIMTLSKKDYSKYAPIGIIIYLLVAGAFAVFTFFPPEIGPFFDDMHHCFGPYWK
ncbi:MAG: DUF6512 family protein [Eubacteriales bacterium]